VTHNDSIIGNVTTRAEVHTYERSEWIYLDIVDGSMNAATVMLSRAHAKKLRKALKRAGKAVSNA
jgi:hypothetical protein